MQEEEEGGRERGEQEQEEVFAYAQRTAVRGESCIIIPSTEVLPKLKCYKLE